MFKTRLKIAILTCIAFGKLNAQPPKNFYKTFGGNGVDIGYDIISALDKSYVMVGSTSSFGAGNSDVYLIKMDSVGDIKFHKTFGGANNDIGKSVTQLADSSFIIAGYTNSMGLGGYDVYVIKTDNNGNLIWQKTFGGIDWDFAHKVKTTTDGGVILVGSTASMGNGALDAYILKLDANGNIQWQKTYGGSQDDEFKNVHQLSDGNYATCGFTKSGADINGDAWLMKLNQSGVPIYTITHNHGLYDVYNDLLELPNDEYIAVGGITTNTLTKLDAYVIKTNSVGAVLHVTKPSFNNNTDEMCYQVLKSNSKYGDYLYLSNNKNLGEYKNDIRIDVFTFALNWVNTIIYGSTEDDEAFAITPTLKEKNKGYATIGFTKGYDCINTDMYVLKYDSMLNVGNVRISSIENYSKNRNVTIYPTQVANELYFKNESPEDLSLINIAIYNIYGEKVFEAKHHNVLYPIILNNLINGIYICNIRNQNNFYITNQKFYKIN